MRAPHGLAAIIAAFGDPSRFVNAKGLWEDRTLRTVSLPTPLPYAVNDAPVTRITAHALVVHELVNLLSACLRDGVPVERLHYGGCYSFRLKRSDGSALSTHAWGIAVDLEPAANPRGTPWEDDGTMLDPRVVQRFEGAGWTWGGHFRTPDAMHFQFASGY